MARARIRLAKPRRGERFAARLHRLPRAAIFGLGAIAAVAVIAIVFAAAIWVPRIVDAVLQRPPSVGTRIVLAGESPAATAASSSWLTGEGKAAAAWLAAQPTAYWLTPEHDGLSRVEDRVLSLAEQAREQDAYLTVVIYGLPDRDCGHHSAGGLSENDYEAWTESIGRALRAARDVEKIVIVEPDSLALASQCASISERTQQIGDVVGRVSGPRTWVYLDGGHSQWHSPEQMASLITQVGHQGEVRGFALNVSNYHESSEEFAYAHAVSEALGGWAHAVVDTSRNGNGSNGEWCNPPGRLVGSASGTYGDDVVDTNIWIKQPGESDGTCNGGPEAGEWWPDATIELTRGVRPE